MGGAGFTEMLLLAVIALIVVGPQKLPKIARTAGRLTRQARNAWQGLQSELQAELDADHNRRIMEASNDKASAPESTDKTTTPEPSAQSSDTKSGDTRSGHAESGNAGAEQTESRHTESDNSGEPDESTSRD